MKNNENSYAPYSSLNKHKSSRSLPKIEGLTNIQTGNNNVYKNIHDFLNKTIDYETCKKQNQQNCDEYQFYQIDSVEQDLDDIRRRKQKAEQEFILCKNQTSSCVEIYNQIVNKTKEFELLHVSLINQRNKITNCQHKKNECDSYQSKIKDLEELLIVYEQELIKLKAQVAELNCSNYV